MLSFQSYKESSKTDESEICSRYNNLLKNYGKDRSILNKVDFSVKIVMP